MEDQKIEYQMTNDELRAAIEVLFEKLPTVPYTDECLPGEMSLFRQVSEHLKALLEVQSRRAAAGCLFLNEDDLGERTDQAWSRGPVITGEPVAGCNVEVDKPCPFCGGSAIVVVDTDSNGDDYRLVECGGCGSCGPPMDDGHK